MSNRIEIDKDDYLFGSESDFMKVLPELCFQNDLSSRSRGEVVTFYCDDPNLLKKFCSLSHGERVAKILPILKSKSTYNLTHGDQKNEETSIKLRQEGNTLMQRNLFDSALAKYTESISIAPVKSACLSLAFANRAAVLKLMGHLQASITDSQRASDYGFPEHLQYKLFTRMAQCFQQLGESELAITNFHKALEHLGKSNLGKDEFDKLAEMMKTAIEKFGEKQQALLSVGHEKKKKAPPPIPKLSYGSNPEVPSASVCIGLRYSEKYGRHFVATRNIKPGML